MNNFYRTLTAFILFSISAPAVFAVTVAVGSSASDQFKLSDGNALPSGSAIRLGTFNTSGENLNLLKNSKDFSTVNALFKPLAEGVPNAGTLTQPGNATQMAMINGVPAPGDFSASYSFNNAAGYIGAGEKLYLWVFNAADPANATEWGIFTGGTNFDVPTSNDFGFPIARNSNVNNAVYGSISGTNLHLAPIPEPSASIMGLLAATCLVLRRRR